MKKLIIFMLSVCLLLSTAGCSKPAANTETTLPQREEQTTTETIEPVTINAPYAAVSLPISTRTVTANDGTVIYTETQQTMSLTLAGQVTADTVILDFMNRVDSSISEARSIEESAASNYTSSENWIPYSFKVQYTPTRIDSGVLSMSGSIVTYSGGSHPDYACVSASYSLISGEPLTLGSILAHEDQVENLRDLVIQKLDAQAEEKQLLMGYKDVIIDRFAGEESYDEDWYFSNTGLCFYFSPYEIAPYSSGVIVAEIPYSELVGIIDDNFFPAENSVTNGNITVVPFTDEAAQNYQQISELVLDPEGKMYFIESDDCILNISVTYETSDEYESYQNVVYTAYYLNPGDAIMVQVAEDEANLISIQYVKDGQVVSYPLVAQ